MVFPYPFYECFIVGYYEDKKGDIDNKYFLYFLSDWLLVFMFTRLYFSYRAIINYSLYTDAYSRKVCKTFGFTSGVRFSYKCHLENNPGMFVLVLFVGTVLLLSYIMRIFEIPYYRHNNDKITKSLFDNYFNSVWMLVVTITTVGYGTLVP